MKTKNLLLLVIFLFFLSSCDKWNDNVAEEFSFTVSDKTVTVTNKNILKVTLMVKTNIPQPSFHVESPCEIKGTTQVESLWKVEILRSIDPNMFGANYSFVLFETSKGRYVNVTITPFQDGVGNVMPQVCYEVFVDYGNEFPIEVLYFGGEFFDLLFL